MTNVKNVSDRKGMREGEWERERKYLELKRTKKTSFKLINLVIVLSIYSLTLEGH